MYDVVIVGAGISGLQAALSVKQAGLSFVVVEARERVGGKVWSVPLSSGRGNADLGAAWINDRLQPRITKYVREFGLKTVEQAIRGTAVLLKNPDERTEYPFGITPDLDEADKKNFEAIRDHVQMKTTKEAAPKASDDAVSMGQYCQDLGANETSRQMINVWSKVMHGVEAHEQPAAFFMDYCRRTGGLFAVRADDHTGGNYLRFVDGTMQLPLRMAARIGYANISLSKPVLSVDDQGSHVIVKARDGEEFRGRRCIISLPTPLFKDMRFHPELPAPVREITGSTWFGDYNKVIVCYNSPWWQKRGYNGFFMSYEGPAVVGRDSSVHERGLYALTCFVNGHPGGAWAKLPAAERRTAILKQLALVFKADADSECWRPIEFFEKVWKEEEFSKGAFLPVSDFNHMTKHAGVYGKPVGNLHFVGTEYAQKWKGFMEGALETGEQGASEVIEATLKKPKALL